MAKANLNGTTSAAASATVAAENNSRRSFFFLNISDTDMVLNFGAAATADDVLTVKANGGSVFLTQHDPYEIGKQINVFCSAEKDFQAQHEIG